MKKKLVYSLFIVAALAVTGCGSGKEDKALTEEKQEEQTVKEDKAVDTDKEEEDNKEKKEKEKEKELKKISFTYQNHPLEATYGNDTFTMGGYYTIELNDKVQDDHPELSEVIEKNNLRVENEIRDFVNGSEPEVLEMWNEGFTGYYEDDLYLHPVRADEKVFSFVEENYVFYGGAHGSTSFAGYNYDPETGREIDFDDVVSDKADLPEIIVEDLIKQNPDLSDYFNELPSDKENLLAGIPERLEDNAKGLAWALDYDGIIINFEDYAMGAYAVGVQSVSVKFKDHPEIFTDKYADYENGRVPDIDDAAIKLEDAEKETLGGDTENSKAADSDKNKPKGVNIIKLSKEDQYKLNVFISNFAEQGFRFYDDEEKQDAAVFINFAYRWARINKYDDIECEGSYYKLSIDKVKKIVLKYFGIKLSDDEIYGYDWDKSIDNGFCKGGYYYVPAADGESYTGFSIVEQAEDAGDGTLWIYFTTYSLDLDIYWDSDESIPKKYYQMTANEAMNSKDLESGYQGMAIVKKDGESYKLKYYKQY